MKYYFAPMEGITTYIYRNLHKKYFGGVDRYYSPFISPTMHGSFTPKERKDILPENNVGVPLVPQILANNGEYFLQVVRELKDYGYTEVNLNLGCPSATVANKCKGSGFLSEPYRLQGFLDTIFSASDLPISIKTRVGRYDEEEWEDLLHLYNKFPIKELIIHPRVQQDFYKKPVRQECFAFAETYSKNPLCYNGEIWTIEQLDEREKVSGDNVKSIMCGRGLLANPALLDRYKEVDIDFAKTFWNFHDELFEAYYVEIGNNALYKMKELWIYLEKSCNNVDKSIKKIRKSKNKEEYMLAISEMKQQKI